MSTGHSLMKISVIDRQDVYLVCSYDDCSKHLRVILLDENEYKAFTGSATDVDLRSQAAVINMVFNDFMSLTLKALTRKKSDGEKFIYDIEKNCEGFLFKWKSVDEEETVINIGSVKVFESDYRSTTNEAFLLISDEMTNLKEQMAVMHENLCSLKKEMAKSIALLTDMNNMKEMLENELYSKFTLVLNEKKQKIRDLKRRPSDTSSNKVNKKQASTLKPKKTHLISDSSDEDTDDPGITDAAGPSTTKKNNSLVFFDESPLSVSPSKKRNRNQHAATGADNPESEINKSPVPMESESDDELFKFL